MAIKTQISRRSALGQLGAAAALWTFTSKAWAAQTGFAPPKSPVLFTRTLRRELSGGNFLSVERSWEITFSPDAAGYNVTGKQTNVAVTAPKGLEALKSLEENRAETGMFPLLLDHSGTIRSANALQASPSVDDAISLAIDRIRALADTPETQTSARKFLSTIQNAAAESMSRMPRDLLFPRDLSSTETRTLDLPGGMVGQIDVRFEAELSAEQRILSTAARTVKTTIGSAARTSTEIWTLRAI